MPRSSCRVDPECGNLKPLDKADDFHNASPASLCPRALPLGGRLAGCPHTVLTADGWCGPVARGIACPIWEVTTLGLGTQKDLRRYEQQLLCFILDRSTGLRAGQRGCMGSGIIAGSSGLAMAACF